jgi:hypothetical protein
MGSLDTARSRSAILNFKNLLRTALFDHTLYTTMALRQRQRNGTNQYHQVKADDIDNNNTLLDEDEQETLIQQINDEYLQQSERLHYSSIVLHIYTSFTLPEL